MAELELIARLKDEASTGLKQLSGEVATLNKESGAAGQAMGALGTAGKVMGVAVAGAAVAGGAAIAKFAVDGVRAFGDFQDGMNEVFTLLPGKSQEFQQQMSADVLALSQDIGRLPNEVIPALYQSLSAGVPSDNVFGFLETAHAAALGGVTDLSTAVDGISSVVNAYGADIMSATQASDLMFTAVRLGKTTFGELSGSLSNVTPLASAMGVSFGDVTAALAAMTAQGTPTAQATTQMRGLLQELGTEGTVVAGVFEKMAGQSFLDFIQSGGNVAEALQLIEQHAAETGTPIQDLFGNVRAGLGALQLTGGGMETFVNNLEAMENSAGATQAAYEQMNTGMKRAFEVMKATVSSVLIELGAALAPFVNMMADKLNEIAQRVLPMVQTGFKALAEVIALFTGAGADAFDTLDNLRELLFGLGASAEQVQFVENALIGLRDAFNTFNSVLDQGRSVFDAIGASIYVFLTSMGVAGDAAYNFADGVRNVIETISGGISTVVDFVKQFVSVQDVLTAVALVIGGVVVSALISLVAAIAPILLAFGALIAVIGLLRTAFETNFAGIRDTVMAVWDAIKQAFEGIKQIFTGDVAGGLETLRGAFEQAFSAIVELVVNLASEIYDGLSAVWDAIVDWVGSQDWGQIGSDIMSFIAEAITDAANFIAEAVVIIWDTISEWVGSVDWLQLGIDIIVAIGDGLMTFAQWIGPILADWFTAFADWVASVDWVGLGISIIEFIITGLLNFASMVATVLGEWYGAFAEWVASVDWAQLGYDIVTFILEGLAAFSELVVTTLADWLMAFGNWVANTDFQQLGIDIVTSIIVGLAVFVVDVATTLVEWYNAFVSWVGSQDWGAIAQSIIDGLANVLKASTAVKDALMDMARGAWDAIKNFFKYKSPSGLFMELGRGLMEGLEIGIIQGKDGAVAAIKTAMGDVKLEALQGVAEMVTAITGAIGPAISALNILSTYNLDRSGIRKKWEDFHNILHSIMHAMAALAWQLDGSRKKTLRVAEIINELMMGIKQGVDALNKLALMKFPSSLMPNLDTFVNIVKDMTLKIADVVNILEGETIVWMGHFAEAVSAVFGMVGVVLEGSRQLAAINFDDLIKWPYYLADQFKTFRNIVRSMMRLFGEAVAELGLFSVMIGEFASAAAEVFGLVDTVMSNTAKLAEMDFDPLVGWVEWNDRQQKWVTQLSEQFKTFRNIVRSMMRLFAEAVNELGEFSKGIEEFASAASAVFGMVDTVLAGTTTIAATDFDPLVGWVEWSEAGQKWVTQLSEQFKTFRNIVRSMMVLFAEAASELGTEVSGAIESYVSAAEAVFGLVDQALSGVAALMTFEAPPLFQFDQLAQQLSLFVESMVNVFKEAAMRMTTEVADAIKQYIDAAGAVVGLIAEAIAAVEAIMAYEWKDPIDETGPLITNLATQVDVMVVAFTEAAGRMSSEVSQAIQNYIDAAGAVVGLIAEAIAAVEAIANYEMAPIGTNNVLFANLAANVEVIVVAFQEAANRMSQEASAAAQNFASAASAILGLVQPGIDAIAAISDYVSNANLEPKIETFKNDLIMVASTLAAALALLAHNLGTALTSAQEAASKIEGIISVIKPAIDALDALSKYKAVQGLADKLTAFTNDLNMAVTHLVNSLNTMRTNLGDGVASAISMANDANQIFTHVKTAVDSLAALAGAQVADIKNVADWLVEQANTLNQALTSASATLNGSVVQAAQAFATAVVQVRDQVEAAINEINAMIKMNYAGSLQNILNEMKSALSNQIGPIGDAGQKIGEAFNKNLSAQMDAAVKAASEGLAKLGNDMKAFAGEAGSAGSGAGDAFKRGLISELSKAVAEVRRLIDQIISVLRSLESAAYAAGRNAGAAFAAGIRSQQNAAVAAARAMANAAAAAARRELDISSPSGVFTEIAKQSIAGFEQPFLRPSGMYGTVGYAFAGAARQANQAYQGSITNNESITINVNLPSGGRADFGPGMLDAIEAAVDRSLLKHGKRADKRHRR